MRLRRVRVEGLSPDPIDLTDLDEVQSLPTSDSGTVVLDALSMFATAFEADRAVGTCALLEMGSDEVDIERDANLLDQIAGLDPTGVRAVLGVGGDEKVRIEVQADLDPELFGQLRAHAIREPALGGALTRGGIELHVGWLFNPSHTHVSVSWLNLLLGGTRIPSQGPDRPAWAPGLAASIGKRILRIDPLDPPTDTAERLHLASRSPDPNVRDGYRRAAAALAEAPFGLGRLELVDRWHGITACFGDTLITQRRHGPRAALALQLAWAAHVACPDILLVELPSALAKDDPLLAWFHDRIESDTATLEQVLYTEPSA